MKIEKFKESVPRGTFDKLEAYANLLQEWNKKFNLISRNITYEELWERHIIDSYVLYQYVRDEPLIHDLGSGAGFPGIVLSIAGIKETYLIESNSKKCVFLNEVAKISNNKVAVFNDRVESIDIKNSCIVSRAMADLNTIVTLTYSPNSNNRYVLLKGISSEEELKLAKEKWNFISSVIPNSNSDGFIVTLSDVEKKDVK